jgi:CubicO group peptidase (beta-lactamase class C family)
MRVMAAWSRRAVLGAAALTGAGIAVGVKLAAAPAVKLATPLTPGRVLRLQPRSEYAGKLAADVARYLVPTPDHPKHPWFPGAVVLTALRGEILAHEAVGDAVRYGAAAVELPPEQRVPARTDTIYDLASLTKLFTTVLALRLVDGGRLDLDKPVSWYLPAFTGKPDVRVSMLLTHTAGLPGDMALDSLPDHASRIGAVLGVPIEAGLRPGAQFHYSDLGFITLGALVEQLAGARLDELVKRQITGPLGMRDTMFAPPEPLWPRVAATEYMPWTSRSVVRGQVHDEAAWALGGVAGHAGLFGTAADMAVFGQLLANGGEYAGTRVLRAQTVARMLVNANAGLGPAAAHGWGVALDQPQYMGALAGAMTFGHTGFTGTSLVVDPVRGAIAVLLTNRVHPDRRWGTIQPARRTVADDLAAA